MKSPGRTVLLVCLTALLVPRSPAHDPYEITSAAYLYSNRIELFVEMAFLTGMTLAGQQSSRAVAVPTQFESALPQLRELAGSFFNLTAGNNVVLPLATNVAWGVEDHLQFRVEFPSTPYRPLRFVARGLGTESSENPYGTTLTVLDMVNQKVLGQATLFAATPAAEFPPRLAASAEAVSIPTAADGPPAAPNALSPSEPAAPIAATESEPLSPTRMPDWLPALATLAAILFIAVAWIRRRG